MLFNSQIFILLFLPLVWFGFDQLRRHSQDSRGFLSWLLLSSIIFFIWWDPRDLPILLGSILGNYLIARVLGRHPGHPPRYVLGLGITANLSLLGWFKYRGMAAETLNEFGAGLSVPEVVLPLAISFFTFQQIAYLIDVSRGLKPERSLLRYAVFVSFFPQLIAGPIVHWREMMPAFDRVQQRDRMSDLAIGLSVFAIGLAKKVLIADSLAPIADGVFDATERGPIPDSPDAWLAMFAYGLQLYFDFSAYSDMALGIARMLGIDLPVNFLSPYRARNIAEFWRRWHITLSRFLKDYLYIPLGGNRRGRLITYRNLLITMALGGLWHGAQWTFLAWGLWHGLGLALHRLWRACWPPGPSPGLVRRRLGRVLGIAATFLFVSLGWVLFRSADFPTAMRMFSALVSAPNDLAAWVGANRDSLLWVGGAAALAMLAPNTAQIFSKYRLGLWPEGAWRELGSGPLNFRPHPAWAMYVVVLLVVSLLSLSRETVFLYFQF